MLLENVNKQWAFLPPGWISQSPRVLLFQGYRQSGGAKCKISPTIGPCKVCLTQFASLLSARGAVQALLLQDLSTRADLSS